LPDLHRTENGAVVIEVAQFDCHRPPDCTTFSLTAANALVPRLDYDEDRKRNQHQEQDDGGLPFGFGLTHCWAPATKAL
jgi:hypothetical protein